MKSVLGFLLVLPLLFSTNCQSQSNFKKLSIDRVNEDRLSFATNISKNILEAQKKGGYYELNETIATSEMISGLNEAVQKESYKQIKSMFGEFRDVEFDHLIQPKEGTLYEIYRFKGAFNPEAKVEVRTVLDAEGKLAGFFVLPWQDKL
jgi:hypothetical protein